MRRTGWVATCLTAGLALLAAAGPGLAIAPQPQGSNGAANGSTARALVTIIGELSYRERMALPPGATLLVTLAEQAGGGDPAGPALARQSIDLAGQQVPLNFRLTAAKAKLKAGERYALRALIQDKAGQPLWSIQSAHVIDPDQPLHDLGMLWLTRAATPAAATELPSPRPPGIPFLCGERQVTVLAGEDSLDLTLDGVTHRLDQRLSASGARYGGAMADGRDIEFWNKGRNARLTITGEAEASCAQSEFPDDPPPASQYEARGRAPDWTLRIGPERLDLVRSVTGTSQIAQVPVPERQLLADGHRYVARLGTGELRVTINPGLCLDKRTGVPFPDRVTVEVGSQELTGCGGSAAAFLAQVDQWTVTMLNGDPVADAGLSMRFTSQGEISGSAGCNRFMARYRADANGLTIAGRSGASTLMACPREVMLREQAFLSALRSVQTHSVEEDGTLVLTGLDDTEIRLRR
ncbi:META domain-containing protein [Niveispirillum sp.]|uniref:META domain-containing protein n=1 Tax=Niveispirillum sp. TaxID=1917217 RepID=UPI001B733619|nr:META domain-containing protein [Niveispirillum sp.]MBP7334438.1 META domain-containing protein [Niveispirillum sp.]